MFFSQCCCCSYLLLFILIYIKNFLWTEQYMYLIYLWIYAWCMHMHIVYIQYVYVYYMYMYTYSYLLVYICAFMKCIYYKKKTTLWLLFWMGFNCLKATATPRRHFTFYHSVPRNFWCSFYRPGKDEGWVNLGATQWFWTRDPWIGNPAPWPLGHTTN